MNARWLMAGWLVFVLLLGGCTTKSSARRQAAEAFAAGQNQAIQKLTPQDKVVLIQGAVRKNIVPWEEGLTLAAAIDAADYTGLTDPKAFVLRRGGESLEISVKDLLRGAVNPELQVGDVIEIRR